MADQIAVAPSVMTRVAAGHLRTSARCLSGAGHWLLAASKDWTRLPEGLKGEIVEAQARAELLQRDVAKLAERARTVGTDG